MTLHFLLPSLLQTPSWQSHIPWGSQPSLLLGRELKSRDTSSPPFPLPSSEKIMTLAGSPGVVQALPVQKSEFPPNRNSHCLSPEAWGGIQDAWQNLAWSLLQGQWLYFVLWNETWAVNFRTPRQELIHQSQHYSATAWRSAKPRPPSNSRVEEFFFFLNVVLSNLELLPICLRNPTCAQVCTHTHTHIRLCKADTDFLPPSAGHLLHALWCQSVCKAKLQATESRLQERRGRCYFE